MKMISTERSVPPMKQKILLLLSLLVLLLGGCSNAEPENPYRLTKAKHDCYDYSGHQEAHTITYEYTYTYTEEGWLAQTDTYQDGIWQSTQVFSHDIYGNICAATTTHADGTSSYGETNLTLDAQHRPIREESYNSDGTLFATQETAYDADGNIIRLITNRIGVLDGGRDWTDTVEYQYDINGNLTRQDIRWNTGSASYVLYDYQDGKLVKETSYTGNGADTVTDYTEYTYDETGFVQTAQNYDKDGQPKNKYITTHDEYGNVLTMETYWQAKDGSSTEILVRTVTNTYEWIPEE